MSKLLEPKSNPPCSSFIRKGAPLAGAAACVLMLILSACQTDESEVGTNSGAGYYGSSLENPWYYGAYNDDADIIVTPPTRPDSTPQPSHPIAAPPRPVTMPSMPRPAFRGR